MWYYENVQGCASFQIPTGWTCGRSYEDVHGTLQGLLWNLGQGKLLKP